MCSCVSGEVFISAANPADIYIRAVRAWFMVWFTFEHCHDCIYDCTEL